MTSGPQLVQASPVGGTGRPLCTRMFSASRPSGHLPVAQPAAVRAPCTGSPATPSRDGAGPYCTEWPAARSVHAPSSRGDRPSPLALAWSPPPARPSLPVPRLGAVQSRLHMSPPRPCRGLAPRTQSEKRRSALARASQVGVAGLAFAPGSSSAAPRLFRSRPPTAGSPACTESLAPQGASGVLRHSMAGGLLLVRKSPGQCNPAKCSCSSAGWGRSWSMRRQVSVTGPVCSSPPSPPLLPDPAARGHAPAAPTPPFSRPPAHIGQAALSFAGHRW